MKQFTVGIDGWYALYFQCIHFFLEKSTVYHFMRDLPVQQSHYIQGLHYIGAVGTCQWYISLQWNRPFQRLNASADSFIRKIFPLSIGIQYCQKQRCEFMTVRYSAEFDTGFFSIFQQREFQLRFFGFSYLTGEFIGTSCYIFQQLCQFLCAFVPGIAGDMKSVLCFQVLEDTAYLI